MADSTGLLTHCVFFTLKDNTRENCQALVDDCLTYLNRPEGVVQLHAGIRDAGLDREVNDTDFDVSLIVVFADRQAHDVYQDHPQHTAFIERNKHTWQHVRVFDAIA
jgi:hypothetical protein